MLTTIQAGRAFAALAVAAFHLSITMGVPHYGGTPILQDWMSLGHLGVDFFFVLSGFVIMMAHHADIGRPEQLRAYAWKRIVRVYPVYLLYTLVIVALVLAGLGSNTPLPQSLSGWLSTLTLLRFSPEVTPISPAWTLFHEVAFYTLFGLLLWRRNVGIAVMAAWLLACAAMWSYPPEDGRTAAAVYLSAYAFHFVIGMAAFEVFRRDDLRLCVAIGAAGLAVLAVSHLATERIPVVSWALGFGGAMLIAAAMERHSGIRAPGWLRYVGDASYSLYLLHLPLQGVVLKLAFASGLADVLGGFGTYMLALVSTVVLACIAYATIEAPLLRVLRRAAQLRPRPGSMALRGATSSSG